MNRDPSRTCCFTGHRSIKAGDVGLATQLKCELETLINVHGVTVFYAGGFPEDEE